MLYGNLDGPTGNSKPKYANTGSVYGVSATEAANTLVDGKKVAHAGWNQLTQGTGPIATITITNAGQGINADGFLSVSGAGGTKANIAYYIANSQNTLQTYSSNSYLNVVNRVVLVSGGEGFNAAPSVVYVGANSVRPTFSITMGGRAGRRSYETLVAMGSITGDDTGDNTFFPGT